MKKDSENKTKRYPKGGIVIWPPIGAPFMPGNPQGGNHGQNNKPQFPGPNQKPELPDFPPAENTNTEDEKQKFNIKIKSVYENEFVVSGNYYYLYATEDDANESDTFRLIILDDNIAKIRIKGGNFIRVDDKDFLVADTDNKGATKFKIYKTDEKEYVLKAPNGYFVRVRENDKRLVARAEQTGKRTRFKFRVVR